MAAKPVDRIRSLITDLERGARTLGEDLRKRAGGVDVTPDIEAAIRQLVQGLTTIAVQLEKAAGDLRRYLEKSTAGAKAKKAPARKPAPKSAPAKKPAAKKAAAKKPAEKKPAAKKSVAKKPAKKVTKKA